MHLDEVFIDVLGNARTERFVNKLNSAYDIMWDLVGGEVPFNGDKMEFRHSRDVSERYEGISGQPILWRTYNAVVHAASMAERNVDLTETPFHEVGHNFDSYRWEFEPEVLATLKILYYFDITGESFTVGSQGHQSFSGGNGYLTYIKSYASRIGGISECYDESIPYGNYSRYAFTYNLGKIAEEIGWQPFKSTFRYFSSLPYSEVPSKKVDKFNLFITKLRDFSSVDVLSMFTSNELQIYGDYLGGNITYDMRFSPEEIYIMAQYHLDNSGEGYQVIEERVPLVDETGKLFAYAIPFKDSNNIRVGHINVGALRDGPSFYLIDPFEYNYWNIKDYSDWGWDIMYSIPFFYSYCQVWNLNQYEKSDIKKESITQNQMLFNEQQYQDNLRLLETISLNSSLISHPMSYVPPTVAAIASENSGKSYVRVNGGNKIFYGGNQSWWKYYKGEGSLTGQTGEWLTKRGCGAVALTDIILYHVRKDYQTYSSLLNYTDMGRINGGADYNYTNFDKTIDYNQSSHTLTHLNYLELLDFYADMGDIPKFYGVTIGLMDSALGNLETYTNYNYIKHKPNNSNASTVETFLISQLNEDNPVMFINMLELTNTQYLLNDPEQAASLNQNPEQDFDNHWMTITKYFKDNNTNNYFVAFASWGMRFSINTDLLKSSSGKYYPDFYVCEIQPK